MEIVAIVISGVSVIIALVSAITSIYYNSKNQKQYNRSLEPSLSFRLIEYGYVLFLQISNTGKSAAHDIKIEIIELENNGTRDELKLDKIFDDRFELYEGEATQGAIAIWGENVVEHTFPKVKIRVRYKEHITQKEVSYTRTVIFSPAYVEKVFADVNVDLKEINSNMKSIAKSNLRTANYLDGCQIAPFDELNIMAGRSLHDDMLDIQKENAESNIRSRASMLGWKAPAQTKEKD